MSMTAEERKAHYLLGQKLKTEGYPTYAKIFNRFHFNFTSDPGVIAFMRPNQGIIVMNRGISADQAPVLVRHEILHDYLKHEQRLLDKLARDMHIDRSELEGASLEQLDNKLKSILYSNDLFNIAADYEISNRGYTEKDKDTVRAILINGRIVSGLVTEDDHPDWVDLSVEQMYDELMKEKEQIKPEDLEYKGFYVDETTFVDPVTGVTYGI